MESSRKKNLFSQEASVLRKSQEVLGKEGVTDSEIKAELISLCNSYEELLDQSKLITKVSDRLQKKINKSNEDLEQKNVELQDTLDSLTRAKVGRKATTITLVIFIIVFLLAEWGVEPHIDEYALTNFNGYWTILSVQLGSKAILALLLKPIEMVVEKVLLKQAEAEIKQQREAEQQKSSFSGIPREILES